MINADMRLYDYFTFGKENEYGQRELGKTRSGQVKMSIDITSQSIQDNINYTGSQYIGLTFAKITDENAIKYGDQMLKVLYVNPMGRLNQVFMAKI